MSVTSLERLAWSFPWVSLNCYWAMDYVNGQRIWLAVSKQKRNTVFNGFYFKHFFIIHLIKYDILDVFFYHLTHRTNDIVLFLYRLIFFFFSFFPPLLEMNHLNAVIRIQERFVADNAGLQVSYNGYWRMMGVWLGNGQVDNSLITRVPWRIQRKYIGLLEKNQLYFFLFCLFGGAIWPGCNLEKKRKRSPGLI